MLDQVEAACRGLLDAALVLADAVRDATGREVRGLERVGGGDINDAYRVAVRRRVVRVRQDPRGRRAGRVRGRGRGAALARGAGRVSAFRRCWAWATPCSCSTGSTKAAAETAPRSARAWRRSTRRARTTFGGKRDLPLGRLALPNDAAPDWPTFYAERRLRPLLPHAGLTRFGNRAVESICERIHDLAGPPEPPARLHGDLWSGNVLWGRDGRRG